MSMAFNKRDGINKWRLKRLEKTAGCANTGAPDKNDWITDYNEQGIVYPAVIDAMTAIEALL